jgi:hypothetical protein
MKANKAKFFAFSFAVELNPSCLLETPSVSDLNKYVSDVLVASICNSASTGLTSTDKSDPPDSILRAALFSRIRYFSETTQDVK